MEVVRKEAVTTALAAGYKCGQRAVKNTYKATERRLEAIPILIKRIEDNRDKLELMVQGTPAEKSKSIARFNRSGWRASQAEVLAALAQDLAAQMAKDEHEPQETKKAFSTISKDLYY